MVSRLALKSYFSIKSQLMFAVSFNEIMSSSSKDAGSVLLSLRDDFTPLVSVLEARMNNGMSFKDAAKETFDPHLYQYLLGDQDASAWNLEVCKLLLTHHKVFARFNIAAASLAIGALLGLALGSASLMVGSGVGVLLIAFLTSPLEKIHAKGLRR